jgi:uncharacterized membrane protein (DUF485 family)
MGVVKTAAPIASNIVLPGSGGIVSGLINELVPGDDDLEVKCKKVLDDPKLIAELKAKAMDLEKEIAKAKVENMAQVNETIQAELVQGRWYQRSWRAWNGFLFPITVLLVYVGIPIANAVYENFLVVPDVPEMLWMTWGGILGVASFGRNQQKNNAAGNAGGLIQKAGGLLRKVMK